MARLKINEKNWDDLVASVDKKMEEWTASRMKKYGAWKTNDALTFIANWKGDVLCKIVASYLLGHYHGEKMSATKKDNKAVAAYIG